MLLISMEMAAGRSLGRGGGHRHSNLQTARFHGNQALIPAPSYLMCSQSTDSKNWWLLISSTLAAPIRFSASVQYLDPEESQAPVCCCRSSPPQHVSTHLSIRSLALSEMGTSGGKTSVSFQFITFRYVSWGVSEQNGG